MNLGQLELALYDRMNYPPTPDSGVQRRIRRAINDAHKEVLSKRQFSPLRRSILTASSVAANPLMVLPQAATKIINIADRTNNRNLDPVSLQDVRYRDPGLRFSGSIPDSYCIISFASCVAVDPAAANSVFVVSDTAADGSGISVSIEGIITGGYYRRVSAALNGLTAVNVDATTSTWEHITKFYVSGNAAGNITLHEGSGVGTELARIPKGRSYPRYTTIHLSPTPASAYTYYCDVELHVEDMVNPNDEPLIPEDFHYLLESGVMKREYLRKEKMPEYGIEQSNWKIGLSELASWLRSRGGVSTGGQRASKGRQFSQLGANFSNGS